MRLAGIEKGGYYPYPPSLEEATASWLTPAPTDEPGRLFDPCCGEGLIAENMGKRLNCTTWGSELFPHRAEIAATRLDKCFGVAWESVYLTDESVSIMWLNPPYDVDRHGDDKRLEYSFLKSATPKLVIGGILVFVVPQKLLGMKEVARHLAGHYEAIRVFRFPDGEYERFKQITLIARRRKYSTPEKMAVDMLQAMANANLAPLETAPEPVYQVPPAPSKGAGGRSIIFRRAEWGPSDLVESTRGGVLSSHGWHDLITPNDGNVAFMPAMPLKKGHLAMLMASGLMGTMHLRTADGEPMLVKGRVTKTVVATTTPDPKDSEQELTTYRDVFATSVATIGHDGEMEMITDVDELTQFMRDHGEEIATHTLLAYRPLYDMKPTSAELAVVNRLSKGGKTLPGQKEPGLLTTQKHISIAAARAMTKYRACNIQGEMGVGKTRCGLAALELTDSYPAIILCPPHLVEKWIREAEEVIPGVKARELRRIGKSDGLEVNDVQDFLNDYERGLLGSKAIAVVANTSAKMGTGWKPVVKTKYVKLEGHKHKTLVYVCPTCGKPLSDEENAYFTDIENFKKKRRFCTNLVPGWVLDEDGRRVLTDTGNPVWGTRPCGTPLFEYSESRRYSIAEYILQQAKGKFKMLVADEVHEYKAKSSDRGIAFHQLIEATDKVLTLTGTFFGGKSTSIFWLLHRTNPRVRDEFDFQDEIRWAGLYGVLESVDKHKVGDGENNDEDGVFTGNRRHRDRAREVPGISPAIVTRLLHNTIFISLNDLGVSLPEYSEDVVSITMEDKNQYPDYTRMEGILRQMAKEEPRLLSMWLQWALARPNSGFRDETVHMNLANVLPDQVTEFANALLAEAMAENVEGTMREAVRRLLAAARAAEDAVGYRSKITITQSEVMSLPAVVAGNNLLPKEQWLVDYCKSERAQRRKVLIYVRQTGTRDIQDRLEQVLKDAGLRVTILPGSVPARKREAWIARQVDSLDVMITNPRLVQTGLDLIDFATVTFFEIEYSLYTLWQALRRVWRLGQTKAVKAVFTVYEEALEESALGLMGKKMRAAQLLYGDEVSGAIVETQETDFLAELAREVLHGTPLRDLQTLFADEADVSASSMGCPTERSAPMLPLPLPPAQSGKQLSWLEWAQQQKSTAPAPRSRKNKPQQGQISMWG